MTVTEVVTVWELKSVLGVGRASNVYVAIGLLCSGWTKCTCKPASSLVGVWLVHSVQLQLSSVVMNTTVWATGRKHWVVSAYLKAGNDYTCTNLVFMCKLRQYTRVVKVMAYVRRNRQSQRIVQEELEALEHIFRGWILFQEVCAWDVAKFSEWLWIIYMQTLRRICTSVCSASRRAYYRTLWAHIFQHAMKERGINFPFERYALPGIRE